MKSDISPVELKKHIEQKASILSEKAFFAYCDNLMAKVKITPSYKNDFASRKRAMCFKGLQLTYNHIKKTL
jgi:hypothetical protein